MPASRIVSAACGLIVMATLAPASAAPLAPSYDAARSTPREDPYYPGKGDPRIDTLHYGLDLRWSPHSRRLHGTATIAFRPMRHGRRIQLDLGRPLVVSAVRLDGRAVTSTHPGNRLVIDTGRLRRLSRHTLRITYAGTPRSARAPATRADIPAVGWTTQKSGAVWTMQEPFGAFTWYPVNDNPSDKAYYDTRIDVPKRWVGIFNGTLRSRRQHADRTITRWHLGSPVASYLTTVAIGDYTRHRDRGPHGLPISYWVRSGQTAFLQHLREMPSMIRWLERLLGPYPFPSAGAVVVPSDSAMETQTLVTMGSGAFSRVDIRAVIAHELTHQWYGDTVTPDNWKDLWLNESFASYIEARWAAAHGGASMPSMVRYWKDNDQFWRDSDGPPGAYDRLEFGDICVYYCGALMLSELRKRVGPVLFDRLLRTWVQHRRDSNQNRASYIAFLNRQTGRHLGRFVTRWLTSPTSLVH